MEDDLVELPGELMMLEYRQDLSQYTYDPSDRMESVNLDVTLMGDLPQQSSQDKLMFQINDFSTTGSDNRNPDQDYGVTAGLDELNWLLPSVPPDAFDSGEDRLTTDNLLDNYASHNSVPEFADGQCDVISPDSASTQSDSTYFSGDFWPEVETKDSVSDADLLTLSTRDLNKKIRHMSQEDQLRIKGRRRTLKNRCYAQTCRSRRVGQHHQLEQAKDQLSVEAEELREENSRLLAEREQLRKENAQVKMERDNYRTKYQVLVNELAKVGCVVHEFN